MNVFTWNIPSFGEEYLLLLGKSTEQITCNLSLSRHNIKFLKKKMGMQSWAFIRYCSPSFNVFFFLSSDMGKHYWHTVLEDYWYYFFLRCEKPTAEFCSHKAIFTSGFACVWFPTRLHFKSNFRYFVAEASLLGQIDSWGERITCFSNEAFIHLGGF